MNPILQFFTYQHLPAHLQEVSKPFCELANWITENLEPNSETSTALRKLLEAKDAAVRAKLYKHENSITTIVTSSSSPITISNG